MSAYLLTGAAGFIGARLAEFLLQDGHEVFGVDNLSQAYDVRMKEYRLTRLQQNPDFHFLRKDITDKALIAQLQAELPPVEAVINLAAIAGVRASTKDPWSYLYTNTLGTLNMLEFCARAGVKKFILASTSSLYGNEGKPPHAETAPTDHPLAPYAASKKGPKPLVMLTITYMASTLPSCATLPCMVRQAARIWSCSASASGSQRAGLCS